MSAIDVRLDAVWKQYRLGAGRKADAFWALRDVTLAVPRGASLGVIGRNGAGKSTLFKLLAGITAPTRGRIVIDGRLAALIEVGSGFHPELTGRENVFLSGAILGMRRREIADKLDRIVAFAGVERFIDTPVKWYSSGMYVRLGFAIAAHLEPDVLLVDEVLAVGDAEFQVKCLQRIDEMRSRGTTCLFISHDLSAVERLCDRAILLEGGAIVESGPPTEVVASYHRRLTFPGATHEEAATAITTGVALSNLTVHDPARPQSLALGTGKAVHVTIRYVATRPLDDVEVELRYGVVVDHGDGDVERARARGPRDGAQCVPDQSWSLQRRDEELEPHGQGTPCKRCSAQLTHLQRGLARRTSSDGPAGTFWTMPFSFTKASIASSSIGMKCVKFS
jgi:ABC-type polysaccharide/polyol phosphate transport system ATPase subunit